MHFHAYDLGPVDHGWEQLRTVEETAVLIASNEARETVTGDPIHVLGVEMTLTSFVNRWDAAKEAAKGKGWEGDFRQDPVVFWIPVGIGFECGFVFKQDNNGTTFVIAPVPMPHLLDDL